MIGRSVLLAFLTSFLSMNLLLVSRSLAADATEQLLKRVQTISLDGVEGRFDHFGVDAEGKRLFAAALGNDTVEVVDLVAGKRVGSIGGLKKPTGVRVVPASRRVVVASGDDGKVRVYDADLKLIGAVNDLDDADNVRLDPDGKLAYVGYGDGAIAVIDPQKAKLISTIKLDGHPEAFQLETTGSRIFVNVPTAKQIAVIDRAKRSVVARWPVKEAAANFPMALDEAGHRLFVGCRTPAKVLVLDTETGNTIGSVDCCGDADDLFFDPHANRLYVSGGEGSVSVIGCDPHAFRLLGNVPAAPGARTSMLIPETGRFYVAVPHRQNQKAEIQVFEIPK